MIGVIVKTGCSLRGEALKTLLSNFGAPLDSKGRPLYSMESIVECAHDWVHKAMLILVVLFSTIGRTTLNFITHVQETNQQNFQTKRY